MEMQAGRNFSAVGIGFGFLDKYLYLLEEKYGY